MILNFFNNDLNFKNPNTMVFSLYYNYFPQIAFCYQTCLFYLKCASNNFKSCFFLLTKPQLWYNNTCVIALVICILFSTLREV